MKKMNILWILLDSIFLIVFNAIVFLLIKEYTTVFWISYGFIHFSYVMLIISSIFIPKTRNGLIFGYPIAYISSVYFFIEFFVGLFFFTIGKDKVNAAIVVQLIIAGIYGIMLISNLIANEQTIIHEQQRQDGIMYIKVGIEKMRSIMEKSQSNKVKKRLEKVYDSIKSSQVKTFPELMELEKDIVEAIDKLDLSVEENIEEDINILSEQILRLIEERNNKIKLLLI